MTRWLQWLLLIAGTLPSLAARAAEPDTPFLGGHFTESRALYPLRVGDWQAMGEHRYEEPELGVSVRYQNLRQPDRWMDLYLYPGGVMFDPHFAQAFAQTVEEVSMAARQRQADAFEAGEQRSFKIAPAPGDEILGDMAVKARSFGLDSATDGKRHHSALAMTLRDQYLLKVRYSVRADGKDTREQVQRQAEAFLSGFAASVKVLSTGACWHPLPVRPMPAGLARPAGLLASANDGRDDEVWVAEDALYLKPALIAQPEQARAAQALGQAVRDALRGRCVAPEEMELAVPDGMREIRFEYRVPPEGTDGSTPRLRGGRTGVG